MSRRLLFCYLSSCAWATLWLRKTSELNLHRMSIRPLQKAQGAGHPAAVGPRVEPPWRLVKCTDATR